MKQANAYVKLSKEHEVFIRSVTPAEVILLVAEHHRNVGGNPVTIDTKSVEEIVLGKDKDGKPTTRSIDDELDRLRRKYGANKVTVMCTEVKEFPDDFDVAIKRGVSIVLPSSSLTNK